MDWTLAAVVSAINIVSFNVKSFKLNSFTGDSFLKYSVTMETSHTCDGLVCNGGRRLNTPFRKRITSGCVPAKVPSNLIHIADKAPLAVFIEL